MSATIAYYGGIVTDGLVIYLNASKRDSYPTYGNTWKSITRGITTESNIFNGGNYNISNGGTISGSLFNGVYYDNRSESFIFDGIDDQIYFTFPYTGVNTNTGYFVSNNNFSINLWCIPNATHQIDVESNTGIAGSTGQGRYIVEPVWGGISSTIAGAGVSIGTNGVSVYEHANGYMPALCVYSGTLSSTIFTNVSVVYSSKQPSVYINGSLARTGLTSLRDTVYFRLGHVGFYPYGGFSGSLSFLSVYNRTLSASEVLQNYNATKGRFGIT